MHGIINKVRLLGIDFYNYKIVEKILVIMPERYDAYITTLDNTRDLSKINLTELINALQTQEQQRLIRQDLVIDGVLQVF